MSEHAKAESANVYAEPSPGMDEAWLCQQRAWSQYVNEALLRDYYGGGLPLCIDWETKREKPQPPPNRFALSWWDRPLCWALSIVAGVLFEIDRRTA